MGFFSKIKDALKKTKQTLGGAIKALFTRGKIGDEFYDELEEILISQGFCRQPEHHAAVRTHDVLAVFAAAAYVFQISAAANGLHNGE